jgi:hypothetical protein
MCMDIVMRHIEKVGERPKRSSLLEIVGHDWRVHADGSIGFGNGKGWVLGRMYPYVCDYQGQSRETLCARKRAAEVLGGERSLVKDG